jgi:hypothetical protein
MGRSPRTEGVWACARIDILSDLRFAPLPIFSRLPRSPRRLEAVARSPASSSQLAGICGAATAHHGSLCCSGGEERGSLGATLKSKAGRLPGLSGGRPPPSDPADPKECFTRETSMDTKIQA